MKKITPFLVILGNLWVWRVFNRDKLLFLLLLFSASVLYLTIKIKSKSVKSVFIVSILALSVIQVKHTELRSLTNFTNEDIRVKDMRMIEYPPVYIQFGRKTLWIPVAHWFEERKETVAFFRILENTSLVLDPNLYFFAGHPREIFGIENFEKFPYILLPLFMFGFFIMVKEKNYFAILFGFFVPFILLSAIGLKSPLGPFLLFPFISIVLILGIEYLWEYFGNNLGINIKLAGGVFITLYILIFIQIISYQLY